MGGGMVGSQEQSGSSEMTGPGQFDLLVGDVGDPSFWSDEVKKAMVSHSCSPDDVLAISVHYAERGLLYRRPQNSKLLIPEP
jgi:hypothetical protein